MGGSDVATCPLRAVLDGQESNRIVAEAFDVEHVSTLERRAVLQIHTQPKGAKSDPASEVKATGGVNGYTRAARSSHPDD